MYSALECVVEEYTTNIDQVKTECSIAKLHCEVRKAVLLGKTKKCIVPTFENIII